MSAAHSSAVRGFIMACAFATGACDLLSASGVPETNWPDYGGGADSSKYVALDQITKANVAKLKVAWTYPTGDESAYQFNPVIVDGVMYLLAKNSSLIAIDAATGRERWIHANLRGIARRGINYRESKDRSDRRLIFMLNNTLQAINARNGESILSFESKPDHQSRRPSMNRRTFLFRSSALAVTAWVAPSASFAASKAGDRIAMGTVLFRYRFKQTRPSSFTPPGSDLTLLDVPQYYRDRFGLSKVEFWSNHFESLDKSYLDTVKAKLRAAGSTLINVQVDASYNLASADDVQRRESLATAKQWIDAAAHPGSTAVRINPGNGPIEHSIASLKEVNAYAKGRGLPLLTENHFGIEMDPDVHLRLRKEAGPENFHTLPDFGNYSDEARFSALEKILPYAWLISAKVVDFNERMEHISYDFDACVHLSEKSGFKGVYSVEQWSRKEQNIDYEKVADWLLDHVRATI